MSNSIAFSAIQPAAQRLAGRLSTHKKRIVFAESCTAGLVAATLATIPGISQWLCGSAVTYRNDTKHQWLGVDAETLATQTAVCEAVAAQMADGVLKQTPEADFALSITGHLGPGAPPEQDGVVFIGTSLRTSGGLGTSGLGTSGLGTSGLGTSGPGTSGPGTSGPGTSGPGTSSTKKIRLTATDRLARQYEAAGHVLETAAQQMAFFTRDNDFGEV